MLWCRVPDVWVFVWLLSLLFLFHGFGVVEAELTNTGLVITFVLAELFLELLIGLEEWNMV